MREFKPETTRLPKFEVSQDTLLLANQLEHTAAYNNSCDGFGEIGYKALSSILRHNDLLAKTTNWTAQKVTELGNVTNELIEGYYDHEEQIRMIKERESYHKAQSSIYKEWGLYLIPAIISFLGIFLAWILNRKIQ